MRSHCHNKCSGKYLFTQPFMVSNNLVFYCRRHSVIKDSAKLLPVLLQSWMPIPHPTILTLMRKWKSCWDAYLYPPPTIDLDFGPTNLFLCVFLIIHRSVGFNLSCIIVIYLHGTAISYIHAMDTIYLYAMVSSTPALQNFF